MWQVTKSRPRQIHCIQLVLLSVLIHLQREPLYSCSKRIGSWAQAIIVAWRRINIFILCTYLYVQAGDNAITLVIAQRGLKLKLIIKHKLAFWHVLNASWTCDSLSHHLPLLHLGNSDKMSHFRLPFNIIHGYGGFYKSFVVLFPVHPQYVGFTATCLDLQIKY